MRQLERGGQLVTVGYFALQIGAYPETIQDTLLDENAVPDLYLLPQALFDLRAGITSAELEFPLYHNYYLQGKKLRFLCRKSQLWPVLRVLREALFGPTHLCHHLEYPQGKEHPAFPDLKAEMAWFKKDPSLPRGRLQLRDCLQPLVFDENNSIVIDRVRITALEDDRYLFRRGDEQFEVEYEGQAPSLESITDCGPEPFKPPTFGVTVIGNGQGSAGFILWIAGRGVLVDPPVNSTDWLHCNGINHRLICDIVLTHCHADHDSGTLQKILQESRITLHTTETVLSSFARKYRALTGLSNEQFLRLFNFSPVMIDRSVNIAGAEFRFKYRLHTIPTLGFEVFFQGKSFVYSSDTLYDPESIELMRQSGVLSQERARDLLDFPWHHNLVFHEAGAGPVHTPVQSLAELPDQVKERLYVLHAVPGSIPGNAGLKMAPSGAEGSIVLDVPADSLEKAFEALDLLSRIDLFSELKVDKAVEFLQIIQLRSYRGGETIIRKGEPGDYFYMVLSGEAEVRDRERVLKTYSRYDYFGELALVENRPRSLDIVARTPMEVIRIGRYDFFSFIRGTGLREMFAKIASNYLQVRSDVFEENPVFTKLSPYQRTQLLGKMTRRMVKQGEMVFRKGQKVDEYFMLAEGLVDLDGKTLAVGSVMGAIGRNLNLPVHTQDARARTDCLLYSVTGQEMLAFFRANPGVYLRILQSMDANSF